LLGVFPAPFAERTATLAVDRAELAIEPIWSALERYFERPATRGAAWAALRARLDTFIRGAPDAAAEMIGATGMLCTAAARDEVAKAFEPHLASIAGGRTRLDRALAAIDQCVARKARVGDLAAAIASSR
jgi:hypothetical protein